MVVKGPEEPPPRTEGEWIDALHQFAANIAKGRQHTSITTRSRVATAVESLVQQQIYCQGYVTVSSDFDDVYVDVQQSAVNALMERLQRARTSAIRTIDIVPIPDQRLMEITIRIHPRPDH